MSVRWLVCIDDTDNLESIGTGKLARWLGASLLERGLVEGEVSVTRHQLLIHPDIPYTSHNSSACIEAWGGESGEGLLHASREVLKQNWHEGANPGLCVIRADSVPQRLVEIAREAQREVLDLRAFDARIQGLGLLSWSSGETGQGRIGACAGAALRSTGEDGRFIGLRGIRELLGARSAGEICASSGVDEVRLETGASVAPEAIIDTRDWVRPWLVGGRAVLVVREEQGRLVPAEQRSKDD
jgi:hypothetical protein